MPAVINRHYSRRNRSSTSLCVRAYDNHVNVARRKLSFDIAGQEPLRIPLSLNTASMWQSVRPTRK